MNPFSHQIVLDAIIKIFIPDIACLLMFVPLVVSIKLCAAHIVGCISLKVDCGEAGKRSEIDKK